MRRLGLDADAELPGMSESAISTDRRGTVGRALGQKAKKPKKKADGYARHMRALGVDAKNYNDEIPDPDLVVPE